MYFRLTLELICLYFILVYTTADFLENYEYIVVGSGPGGGPLAARLAIAGHKVLLLEAGDDQGNSFYEVVPAFNYASSEYDQMRWDYFVNHYDNVTRQEKDTKLVWATPSGGTFVGLKPPAGSSKKGVWYPRAGTLGGCGSHNALISVYPHRSDWSYIASLTGDDSWNPHNMRKYFKRLENIHYQPPSLDGHGTHGWLGFTLPDLNLIVADVKILSLITAAANAFGAGLTSVVTSLQQLRQIINPDMNSADPGRDGRETLYEYPNAVENAKRSGPRNFIVEVANAVNSNGSRKYHLDIRLNCLVTKVRFSKDDEGKLKAIGVDFLDGKSLYKADPRANFTAAGVAGQVNATREIIISAGAYNTPQLLKLSGIGPKDELSKLGISTVVNLPGVGSNLQDRYEVAVIGDTDSDFEIWNGCTFGRSPDPCFQEWQTGNGSNNGPYADNGLAVAFVKKSSAAAKSDPPDIIVGGAPLPFKGYYPGYSIDAVSSKRRWSWVILKAHTRNHAGTVTLKSSDPRDTPLINFRYFDEGTTDQNADRLDLAAVTEAVQFARKLFQDVTLVSGSSGFTETWPGLSVASTDQIKDWVRNEAWGHHASCTCAIGPDDDPMAVLDSEFRVRGVQGLRVVDASVFPKIPGFYIVVSIYMISEKASDAILAAARE